MVELMSRPLLLDLYCGAGGAAMGIDWMTNTQLNEAIPPAYSEWIGRQLLDKL